tara:strand:- start:788 stop:1315 length:528 start_codon:yes stop_codon:yes gene_type:complete
MAQEFTIKSQDIEDKINQLLPTQGGFQPGVDFSASTMVVPIVDLTETAEGSSLRQDLQSAFSHTNATQTLLENSTSTLVNTPGFYQVQVTYAIQSETTAIRNALIKINDGTTDKIIWKMSVHQTSNATNANGNYKFIVFLSAGDSLIGVSDDDQVMLNVTTRQLADVNGNLITVS